MQEYQLSCSKMTVYVKLDHGVIVSTAPVTCKFIGQHYSNLTKWMKQFGKVSMHNLYSGHDKREIHE